MFANRKLWLKIAALLSGAMLLVCAWNLAGYRDKQSMYYNMGLQFYSAGSLENAYKAFELSAMEYKRGQRLTYFQRLVYPKPSAELAALADFQKGKVLLQAQQMQPAVEAFKESLMINPGDGYSGISVDDANRMHEQAMQVKYDLELLFKNNKDLASGEGKGKPGKGPGKGNKPVPGQDPSTQPGKGNRDDI